MRSYDIHTETATVKRYTKKIKNKAKNAKKEYRTVETVNIGLGKYSEFKDNEEVVILNIDDYKKLIADCEEIATDDIVINSADKVEIIRLYEEINKLQSAINSRNELLFSATAKVDKLIDDIILLTAEEYSSLIDDNNKENRERLQEFVKSIIEVYQSIETSNIRIAEKLDKQVNEFNKELANISFWKLWRNKRKLNLRLATDDLKQPIQKLEDMMLLDIDIATEKILKKPEIAGIAIDKVELKNKNIDFQELYIKTDLTADNQLLK